MPLSKLKKMLYTFLMETSRAGLIQWTDHPLDAPEDLRLVEHVGGGDLHGDGDADASKQVPAGGEHHLKSWACDYYLILAVR